MRRHLIAFTTLLILFTCSNAGATHYQFVTFHYPPLEYATANQNATGGVVEIVKKVMHNLGHEVTIKAYPWTRALKMVKIGEADAVFTAYKDPERETFMEYSNEVLFPQLVYFYKRKGDSTTFNGNLDTLTSKKIGVVSTISYGQTFETYKPHLQLDRTNNLQQNFNKLIKKRVDLIPSDIYVAEHTLSELGLSDEVIRLPIKLESVPSFIAFSKKRDLTDLRDKFDRELRNMKQSGDYYKLLKQYNIHQRY